MVFFRLESAAAEYLDGLCKDSGQATPNASSATVNPVGESIRTARAIRAEFIASELQRLCDVFLVRLHSLLLSAGSTPTPVQGPRQSNRTPGSDVRFVSVDAFCSFVVAAQERGGTFLQSWPPSEREENLRLCVELLRDISSVDQETNNEDYDGRAGGTAAAASAPARLGFVELIALTRCCAGHLLGVASDLPRASAADQQRRPQLLRARSTIAAPVDDSSYRCSPWSLSPRERELLAPFANDADVLAPVAVLSRFLAPLGQTVEEHFFVAAAAATTGGSCWGALCICPSRSPVNPHRREKDVRLSVIRHIADAHEYNTMVQRDASGRALGLAADSSTVRQLSSALGASTTGAAELRAASQTFGRLAPSDPRQQRESYATFIRDISFGFDMRLMSLAGSVVGYYIMYSRGSATDQCVIGAAVGAVVMLLVDAVMLLFRVGREDRTIPGHRGVKQKREHRSRKEEAGEEERGRSASPRAQGK